jgi:uncharacterized surface protein with fasciclin (FAS1) repeats
MKLTTFSKSVRSIGLTAMLSIVVGLTATACNNTETTKPEATKPTTAPVATTPAAPTAASPTAQAGTIVEVAASNPSFTTLVTAVKAAGLAETLSGKGPFTVFAPTNEAFAALPKGTLEKLLKPENRDVLKKVLTYHVVSGDLMAKDLKSGKVPTVEGSTVAVKIEGKTVSVNDASVVKADVDTSNGVIHVIDKVLVPAGL